MHFTFPLSSLHNVYWSPQSGAFRVSACFLPKGPILASAPHSGICPSMIIFKIPPVIPTRGLWLVMFLIGIFGLIAQVCPLILSSLSLSDRGILNWEDTSGHGVPTGDSFSWYPCHVYLSMCSLFTLRPSVGVSQLF